MKINKMKTRNFSVKIATKQRGYILHESVTFNFKKQREGIIEYRSKRNLMARVHKKKYFGIDINVLT